MRPGRYRVRDERGRLVGVLVVLEHHEGTTAMSMWVVASGFARQHGAPIPPKPPDGWTALVRWAGSTTRWTATDVELRRLGVAEEATWP